MIGWFKRLIFGPEMIEVFVHRASDGSVTHVTSTGTFTKGALDRVHAYFPVLDAQRNIWRFCVEV